MTRVFKRCLFPKYIQNSVVKSQMSGFEDPTLCDFSLLDFSALVRDEYKEERFEAEFIESFLNAAKVLALAGRKEIDRQHVYVFCRHSYALPVLFLTRHCMELSIKRAIKRFGYEPEKIHGLQRLWDSLTSRFPSERSHEDRTVISNMGSFVRVISSIDDTGVNLRYPKDRKGDFTQDKPLFINNEKVVSYLQSFVEQLDAINFDSATRESE